MQRSEFVAIRAFIFDASGILLGDTKSALVTGRLGKRLRARGISSYASYLRLLVDDPEERQAAIDLLTTNETYFFREPRHFDFLRELAGKAGVARRPFRVWSAASSSGEEAYSAAMVLADVLGDKPWEVIGTDISSSMVAAARRARYPLARTQRIPDAFRRRFCLRGVGPAEGTLLVDGRLRRRVSFLEGNLNGTLPAIGEPFDLIFLRNVMIYFPAEVKTTLVARLVTHLRPGGHLLIGHSESLNGVCDTLDQVGPSIFRKS
ncbi:MAG: methyltransferase domain-containing protein [Betaproteobacteria bacterium]|nr:methyltransferase domain-containing protein [Betaproteobacteria bacterium]